MQKLKLSRNLPERTSNTIKDALKDKNDGAFLWVSFVVEDLRSARTGKEMMGMLSRLPTKLFDIYDAILLKIPKHEQKEAIQVFHAIVARRDPWSLNELSMLCCMLGRDTTTFPQPDDFGQWLNYHSYCNSLVRVTPSNDIDRNHFLVEVVHSSVRDYLVSDFLRQHPTLSRYYCNVIESRLAVFSACCKFRKLLGPRNIAQNDLGNMEDAYRECNFDCLPLLKYCLCANYHNSSYSDLVSDCNVDEALLTKVCDVMEYFRDPGFLLLAFTSRVTTLADYLLEQDWVDSNWIEDNQTILGAAVWCLNQLGSYGGPLTSSVSSESLLSPSTEIETDDQSGRVSASWERGNPLEKLLRHPQLDVNLRNGHALSESLIFSSNSITLQRLLSHHDIDVNILDDVYGTPLEYGVFANDVEKISVLLSHPRTDVNIQDPRGDTALYSAAYWDQQDVLKILLEHPRTNINLRNDEGRTALTYSATKDNADIVRILLEHPNIDINMGDRYGKTALHQAARNGSVNTVGILCEHPDVDINARNDYGETALHYAARNGHIDIVETLLGHPNIDINIRDQTAETALSDATCEIHPDVVKLLLESPDIDLSNDEDGFNNFKWSQWQMYCAVKRMIYARLVAEAHDNIAPDPRFWLWSPDPLFVIISDQTRAKIEAWEEKKRLGWLMRRFGWMPLEFEPSLHSWKRSRLINM